MSTSRPSPPASSTARPPAGAGSGLREVAWVALKLGCTAFGGPAVHIAMLRDEVVVRRRWLTDEQFVDLLGATNLIPGPNSTEMVIHVGRVVAGWRGLVMAGALFILPAALIVLALAHLYVRYGTTPTAGWLLYGIKPVIIAVVVQAIWGLARTAVKGPLLTVVGLGTLALYLTGTNELALLFGAGVLVALIRNARRLWQGLRRGAGKHTGTFGMLALGPLCLPLSAASGWPMHWLQARSADLWVLFLTFLKICSVLYGSGYVLLAFLRGDLVERFGWLTDRQLLDAVAVGQFTPGPVFTTATFIGYVLAGLPGAALCTLGIFLPSFVFVALTGPLIPRLRRSAWVSSLLDGVNVAALGLMAAVTWALGRSAIVDWWSALLALTSALLLLRFRVNPACLVPGGAVAGLVGTALHLTG